MTTIIVNVKNNETLWSGKLQDVEVQQILNRKQIIVWDNPYSRFITCDMLFHRLVSYKKIELEHPGLFLIITVNAGEKTHPDTPLIQETIENYYTVQRVLTPEKRAWLAETKDDEKTINLIKRFIEEMKSIKPDVEFTFKKHQHEDRFIIAHDYVNIHDDKEYRGKMNHAHTRWFSDNNVYNVSIIKEFGVQQ